MIFTSSFSLKERQTQQSGYKDVRRSFQVVLYLIELSQSLRGQDHLSQSNFVTI
jgi:hypothetical protein